MNAEERTKSTAKGQRTMQKLFDSAAMLFSSHEFDKVSIQDIVEVAGVSKGTFYLYFESKDALIAAFLLDYVSKVDADYQRHLDAHPGGTASSELVISLAEKIADVMTDTIGYYRMSTVYKVLLARTVDMDTIKDHNRRLYQIFAGLFQRGMEQGEFHTSLSAGDLARHFVMAIRGLCYEWCIRYPDFDLKEQTRQHMCLMLHGISAKPGT